MKILSETVVDGQAGRSRVLALGLDDGRWTVRGGPGYRDADYIQRHGWAVHIEEAVRLFPALDRVQFIDANELTEG